MRNKVIILMLGVLLCSGELAKAGYVDISEDTAMTNVSSLDTYRVFGSSVVSFYGNSVSELWGFDSSNLVIHGGNIGTLGAAQTSHIELWGGAIGTLVVTGSTPADIYGYDFSESYINPFSSTLTGKWANGSSFTIYLRSSASDTGKVMLNEIPEPATICLLVAGILVFRKLKAA